MNPLQVKYNGSRCAPEVPASTAGAYRSWIGSQCSWIGGQCFRVDRSTASSRYRLDFGGCHRLPCPRPNRPFGSDARWILFHSPREMPAAHQQYREGSQRIKRIEVQHQPPASAGGRQQQAV